MSDVPSAVTVLARPIAAGLHTPTQPRITISLAPDGTPGEDKLQDWPAQRDKLGASPNLLLRHPGTKRSLGNLIGAVTLQPVATPPLAQEADWIADLWLRAMQGRTGVLWDEMHRALREAHAAAPAQTPSIVTPAPHASVAISLARGRLALDALARPDSPLLARGPGPYDAAPIQLAELANPPGGTASDAVLDWPDPAGYARAALGLDGGLAGPLRRIQLAQAAATPNGVAPPQMSDEELDARRLLGGILADPVLQRLFGMSVDFHLERSALEAILLQAGIEPDASPFLLLALDMPAGWSLGPQVWTLARWTLAADLRGPPIWYPARWEEQEAGSDAACNLLPSAGGINRLARAGRCGPRYDLCTLDPELATESDDLVQQMRERGSIKAEQVQTLRSGGLRLLDRDGLCGDEGEPVRDSKQADQRERGPDAALIFDADCLLTAERLDLGLDLRDRTEWRCASHRIVQYKDPDPPPGHSDWVEGVLARMVGQPGAQRRLELSAGTVGHTAVRIIPHDDPNDTDPSSQKVAREAQVIAQATLASWSGEPMGASADPPLTQDHPLPPQPPLAIDQFVDLPRSPASPPETLAMPMRLGLPYRAGLRLVFMGGVSLSLAEAAHAYAGLGACLPPLAGAPPALSPSGRLEGRRVLRHERLGPPALGMTAFDAAATNRFPRQDAQHAVVRTDPAPARAQPASVRRILLPPAVPQDFAALHDSFRAAPHRRQPPRGSLTAAFIDNKANGERRAIFRVGHTASHRYPDPAAAVMVLRLQHIEDPSLFLSDPLVLSLAAAGRWPDLPPVHLTLRRVAEAPARRLRALPQAWLIGDEELVQDAELASNAPLAVPVLPVEVLLAPAEDVNLLAWCAPSARQLADWFDVTEAMAALATHEGAASALPHAPAPLRCAAGLQALLGGNAPTVPTAPAYCTTAGGLAVPAPEALLPLATMLHNTLLQRPVPVLAAHTTLHLTHAVAVPLKPAILPLETQLLKDHPEPPALRLARRHAGPAGGTAELLRFVANVRAIDWTDAAHDPGSTVTVFGGRLSLDPTSTVALELLVEFAGRGSRPLDDPELSPSRGTPGTAKSETSYGFTVAEDGHVTFPQHETVALRLDGLPLPRALGDGRQTFALEALLAEAWSGDKARALRAALNLMPGDTSARRLTVRPRAIGRHAELLLYENETPGQKGPAGLLQSSATGDRCQIWLPATQRPTPPKLRDIIPLPEPAPARYGRDGAAQTVTLERRTRVRVRLERAWFSSGEGERLGLVLWPPALRDLGTGQDQVAVKLPDELLDQDIGPGGAYVTRWGADPAALDSSPSPLLPVDCVTEVRMPSNVASDPLAYVPRAQMPLPTDRPDQLPFEQQAEAAPTVPTDPVAFLAVALKTFRPWFDLGEECWCVDLDLDLGAAPPPFVRLGLVRYQPNAREDEVPPPIGQPVRLRVSAPARAWLRPLPYRSATATWRVRSDGATEIDVQITGRTKPPADGEVRLHTGLRVELLAETTQGGWMLAVDAQGVPCRWESWRQHAQLELPESSYWITGFVLPPAPGRLSPRLTVAVEEVAMASQDPADATQAGPQFLAMLKLWQEANDTPGTTDVHRSG